MLSIYEKSKLYSLPLNEYVALKHKSVIKAIFLIFIKSEIEINNELIEMLDKIVHALKLDANNVEYLSFKNEVSLMDIANQYEAKKILVFGAETNNLNLNMNLVNFKVYALNNKELLLANNIIDVYSNQNLKSVLWKHLQTMF